MRDLPLRVRSLVPYLLAALCACRSPDAPIPAALAIVSGDSLTGPAGQTASDSLVVMATGPGGSPVAGVRVTWMVTAGSATLAPARGVTDGHGRAKTAVTFGEVPGAVTVTAQAATTAVTFHVTSLPPCAYRAPYSIGATVSGTLNRFDCALFDGSFADLYGFRVSADRAVRIRLVSTAFDAFLFLDDSAGAHIAAADDDSTSSNAALYILLAPGQYTIEANSFSAGETGAYTLSSADGPASIENCTPWWVMVGVRLAQSLTATDCDAGAVYYDEMYVVLDSGATYTFTDSAAGFSPVLQILPPSGNPITVGGIGGSPVIHYALTATTTNGFVVFATSWEIHATGAYALSIAETGGSTASGAVPVQLNTLRRIGHDRRWRPPWKHR